MAWRLGWTLLFLACGLQASEPVIPRGQLVPSVACQGQPAFTYALYLPRGYTEDRAWPVLYVFAPDADVDIPMEAFREEAEKLGFILVGSRQSRNGAWERIATIQEALWKDVNSRFRVDPRRSYAAGMSGAARAALRMALDRSGHFAGVITFAAFFPAAKEYHPSSGLSFYLAAGQGDFNHWEMLRAKHWLEDLHLQHWYGPFPGGHGWPPREAFGQALEFMHLAAMRQKRIPADPVFEADFAAKAMKEAEARAIANDQQLLVLRMFQQIAVQFPESDEGRKAAALAKSLDNSLEVKETRNLEAEYGALQQDLLSVRGTSDYLDRLRSLKASAWKEGAKAKFALQVLQGELHWVDVEARGYYARKNWKEAARLFMACTELTRQSPQLPYWAAQSLARLGREDEALEYLNLAKGRGFREAELLAGDPAFESLRSDPRFVALLAGLRAGMVRPSP